MTITRIEARQLRNMENHEGLVIQGCGGELQEWADGINEMLTEADILKNGSRFEKCYAFKNENLTCMLFPFEEVQLEMGKLAMWRLQTHDNSEEHGYRIMYRTDLEDLFQNRKSLNVN